MMVARADVACAAMFAAGAAGDGTVLHCSDSRRVFDGAMYQYTAHLLSAHYALSSLLSCILSPRYSALAAAVLLLPAVDDASAPRPLPAASGGSLAVHLTLIRLLHLSAGSRCVPHHRINVRSAL